MKMNEDFTLLKDLLRELYFEDEEVPNADYGEKNVVLSQVNENELQKELTNFWVLYLGNSVDYQNLKEGFKEIYSNWNKQQNFFTTTTKNSEIIKFLEENFEKSIEVGFKIGEISHKQIQEILNYRRPQISKDFKGWIGKYINLLIFSNNFIHITLHLKLESFQEESFLLTTVFSFWVEHPKEISSFDINYINNSYANQVVVNNFLKKLESLSYHKVNLFDIERYEQNYTSNQEYINDWVNSIPLFFINKSKQALNANPILLFDEIVSDLHSLSKTFIKTEKDMSFNPRQWFDNLSQELKIFYNKGKDLFLNTSSILEPMSLTEEPKEQKAIKKEDKDRVKLERIIIAFQKSMEEDLKDSDILPNKKGYRTFHQIFIKYLDKNNRDEKYDYIKPISQGTFYNLIKKYKQELDSILEKSSEMGKGGGELYRIISYEKVGIPKTKLVKKTILDEKLNVLKLRQVRIHEGLFYYKNQNYIQAIEIFQNILDSGNSQSKEDDQYYPGLLYHIGKCYLKVGKFHEAIPIFKNLYEQDNTKIDNGFKLILAYFNVGDYNKAKSLAFNLYAFLVERLNPYSSLDNKNILFRDSDRFLGVKPEDLHPNVFTMKLFNKYLIMLNRDIRIQEFMELPPRDHKDWENYQRKYEKAQEQSYYLSINIYTFRKLKFLLYNILQFILEIDRRKLVHLLVFDEDAEGFKNQISNIIPFLREEIIKGSFRFRRVNDFLLFSKKLAELILKDEKEEFDKKYINFFPEFDSKAVGPSFFTPKEAQFITKYLFYMNIALPNGNFDWAREQIVKEFNRPELIAENMVLEVISLIKDDLEKAYKKTETDFKAMEELPDKELEQLFPKWKYSISLYGWGRSLNHISDNIESYIEYCETYKLNLYSDKLKSLNSQFEGKIKQIIDKKSKGRRKVIKKLLKNKYESFEMKKFEKIVDLREKPDTFNYEQFYQTKVLHEIFMLRKQNISDRKITFLLFNPIITKEIYQDILKNIETPSELQLNIENNEVIYKEYYWTLPARIKLDFTVFLDYFLYDLFDMFEKKTDKICVKYITDMQDDVRLYFQTEFIDDFKNPFFDFTVKDHPDGMYFSIIINKKGVK